MRTRNRRRRRQIREHMRSLQQVINGALSRLSPTKGGGTGATSLDLFHNVPLGLDDTASDADARIRAAGFQ